MKKLYAVYIFIVLLILALPAVLIPFYKSGWKSETSSLAEAPKLADKEGKINVDLLSDAGAWFEDHFAFRPELITADAVIQTGAFNSSASAKVITGTDGWLYFNGTMPDYQRTRVLSDRALKNMARNLKMIQDYYELLGIKMVFTVAPNKCSLYPEYLPYYIVPGEGESNAKRLEAYLKEEGVAYADMFEAFSSTGQTLYYKSDTHWNTLGAALAFDTLMGAAGHNTNIYKGVPYDFEGFHTGDLSEMLYPAEPGTETDAVYDIDWSWNYTGVVSPDNMDERFETINEKGSGTVFVYRDSFGSALVPFMAQQYAKAVFSRLTPYNISDAFISGADTVIIERAERNLYVLAGEAPIMQNPSVDVGEYKDIESDTTCEIYRNGGFYVVKGVADPVVADDGSKVYVRLISEDNSEEKTFEAFLLSDGNIDSIYQVNCLLPADGPKKWTVSVLIENDTGVYKAAEMQLDTDMNYKELEIIKGEE